MDHLIFDKWTSLPGKAETVLLSAPFTFPPAPSIALSVFKSCLTEAGISSIVLYPVFPLIHALGMESASELSDFAPAKCMNEFLFAHLTDVNNEFDEQNFVEEVFREGSEEWRGQFAERLAGYRRKAAQCVDMTARRVVSMGAKVVAASSIYSQQNASLAVFRRVKELDPGIKTIIGGFNVSGDMGHACCGTTRAWTMCSSETGMRSSLKRFGRQRPADTGRSWAEGCRAASTLLEQKQFLHRELCKCPPAVCPSAAIKPEESVS